MRSAPDFASFSVTAHYAAGARESRAAAGRHAGGEPPSTIPDIRSLFLGFHYSIAKLPDTPMRPRVADARIGYFGTDVWDFTTDDRRIPIVHYINRWRLEKKDPAAALSEPVQPIVFWIDRTVPVKYRAAIREGVLEWNKAFERIGFKDAIQVEVQPDDANFNTSDIRHASIRWMTTARSSFSAIGPTVVDPRTGEILDADIGIDATSFRALQEPRRREHPAARSPAAPASHSFLDGAVLQLRHEGDRARGVRHVAPGSARRDDARRARGRSVHPVEAQGDDDARGGPHARAHAQLPRVDRVYRRAARRPRIHEGSTASRAR